jgi:hypothetical protein
MAAMAADPYAREVIAQMRIRARVLSKKRILASDPSIGMMNITRWNYEAWQLRLDEEQEFRSLSLVATELLKSFRVMLCSVLGNNLEPIEVPDPANPDKTILRWQERDEFLPLIMAIARPDYVKQAVEKIEAIKVQEGISQGTTEIDGYAEEDLEFFDEFNVDELLKDATQRQSNKELDQFKRAQDEAQAAIKAGRSPIPRQRVTIDRSDSFGIDPKDLEAIKKMADGPGSFGKPPEPMRTGKVRVNIKEDPEDDGSS